MKKQAQQTPWTTTITLENKTTKVSIILTLTLILLTIIPLYLFPSPSVTTSSPSSSQQPASSSSPTNEDKNIVRLRGNKKCDIFRGEWVPNPRAPYYTNNTCWAIHDHQNCMKFGRPDTDFLKWRWKPDGCELPVFNPAQFLELVKGKSLAFLGDSGPVDTWNDFLLHMLKMERGGHQFLSSFTSLEFKPSSTSDFKKEIHHKL